MKSRMHGTLAQKRAWYHRNKASVVSSQEKQYEKAKSIARAIFDDYVRQNPDDLSSTKRLYRDANKKAYSDPRVAPYFNYYKWRETAKENRAEYREKAPSNDENIVTAKITCDD